MEELGVPDPVYIFIKLKLPVTLATESSSLAVPTLTVTLFAMFAAGRFDVVTASIVWVPVRYVPLAIVCDVFFDVIVAAPLVVTLAVKVTLAVLVVALDTPALTVGEVVTPVLVSVIVFVPVVTLALDPDKLLGSVAEPFATAEIL